MTPTRHVPAARCRHSSDDQGVILSLSSPRNPNPLRPSMGPGLRGQQPQGQSLRCRRRRQWSAASEPDDSRIGFLSIPYWINICFLFVDALPYGSQTLSTDFWSHHESYSRYISCELSTRREGCQPIRQHTHRYWRAGKYAAGGRRRSLPRRARCTESCAHRPTQPQSLPRRCTQPPTRQLAFGGSPTILSIHHGCLGIEANGGGVMLVAVGSVTGSPGGTTLALALAATWPEENPVLVECDADGGDLAELFQRSPEPGLSTLVSVAEQDSNGPEHMTPHQQRIGAGLGVATVLAPRGDDAEDAVAKLLKTHANVFTRTAVQRPVVMDVGRLRRAAGAQLARHADHLLVVARPRALDLLHVKARVSWLRAAVQGQMWLVVRGDERSWSELSDSVGLPVAGYMPEDSLGARLFTGRGFASSWRTLPLSRAAHLIALTVIAAGRPVHGDLDPPVGLRCADSKASDLHSVDGVGEYSAVEILRQSNRVEGPRQFGIRWPLNRGPTTWRT